MKQSRSTFVLALGAALAFGSAPLAAQTELVLQPQRPSDATLEAFDLYDGQLVDLELPAAPGTSFELQIPVQGAWRTLSLYPYSVRSADYQLLVENEYGDLVPTPASPSKTYRGHVSGYPDSVVAASLRQGRLEAFLQLTPESTLLGIQSLAEVESGTPASRHMIYDSGQSIDRGLGCGTDTSLVATTGSLSPLGSTGGDAGEVTGAGGGGGLLAADIACDADTQYYNSNGSSVVNTENDIEAIINAVAALYENQVNLTYELGTIIVRTQEPDPFSTSNPGGLLNEFANHWFFNQGAIQRDMAHLFTGKNLDGTTIGIARFNSVCSNFSSYGLSQAKYTNNFTNRVGLVAHELGHNWSASHCNGISDCRIMCSSLGACGPVTTFGNNAKNSITNKANSIGCLSPPGPDPIASITGVDPAELPAFTGLTGNTVTITGDSFTTTSAVTVGGVPLSEFDYSIVNDSTLTIQAPDPTALGSTSIFVTNESGVSNAGILTFVETDPPALFGLPILPAGVDATWEWGGGPNEFVFFQVATDPTVFPFAGSNVLVNGFTLNISVLDSRGLGGVTIPAWPTLPLFTQVLSQIVTWDGVNTFKASNIFVGLTPLQ